jgi:hypothetical protein
MDAHRFDTIARLLASRRTRRAALRDGAAGLAGLAAIGTAATARAAWPPVRRDAVPAAQPHDPALLFVQVFGAGELAPKDGEPDAYTLTLSQGTGSTLYFSDRPDRIVGTWPTAVFVGQVGFTPENPPNAALVAQTPDGEAVYVVELLDPVLDEAAGTLTYDVRLLGEADVDMRFQSGAQAAPSEALTFGASHLFVDDVICGSHDMECYLRGTDPATAASLGSIGKHEFTAGEGKGCLPYDGCTFLNQACNDQYSACGGNCFASAPYWVRRRDTEIPREAWTCE